MTKKSKKMVVRLRVWCENIKENLITYRRDHLLGLTTLLLTSQALLVSQLSKKQGYHHPAESLSIAFLLDTMKLAMVVFVFMLLNSCRLDKLLQRSHFTNLLLYAVPAILYFVNDNLLFAIYTTLDPTTFEILASMRIIFTSLLYRFFMRTAFSKVQWIALFLLVIGSLISQLVTCEEHTVSSISWSEFRLVVLYCFISSFAGVFIERLLKRNPNEDFLIQNMKMYLCGAFFNGFTLLALFSDRLENRGVIGLATENAAAFLIIINHALSGLAIAATMRYSNNIARVYAHTISMVLTMLISSMIYSILPSIQAVCGVCIVCTSIYLFYIPEDDYTSPSPQSSESSV